MGYVSEQIVSFVRGYLDNYIDTLKYDRTLMGKIVSIADSTAVVELNGEQVTCRIKDGLSLAVGDVIIIRLPNNNKDKKYIDGKLKK